MPNIGVSGLPILAFERAGVYWIFLQNGQNTNPPNFETWSSPDGVTWALVQTGPQSPAWSNGSGGVSVDGGVAMWDGADTVTMAYQAYGGGVPFFGDNFLIQFDLVSGTWGSPFADQTLSGSQNLAFAPIGIYQRSDGGITVLYFDCTQIGSDAPRPFKVQTWSGSSWGPILDITTNAAALSGFDGTKVKFQTAAGVMDANNVLHVMFTAQSGTIPSWQLRVFYQEVSAAGSLQNFQQIGGSPNVDINSTPPISPGQNLFIFNNQLYWGVQQAGTFDLVAYVGSPLIGPSWTITGDLAGGHGTGGAAPLFAADGTALFLGFETSQLFYASISTDGFNTNTVKQCSVSAGVPPTGGAYGPLFVFGSAAIVTGQVEDEGGPSPVAFTPFAFTPPAAPAIKVTLRGVKRIRCKPESAVELPSGRA